MTARQGEVLLAGSAVDAPALVLTAPISFWGGVDPRRGVVADPRHPEHGESLADRVVCIPATVGSSSAAAVLLELVHGGRAPAAIVLHEADAILLLGLIVAKEMGYATPIAVRMDAGHFATFKGHRLAVDAGGGVAVIGDRAN